MRYSITLYIDTEYPTISSSIDALYIGQSLFVRRVNRLYLKVNGLPDKKLVELLVESRAMKRTTT